jgi:hypothetical protein
MPARSQFLTTALRQGLMPQRQQRIRQKLGMSLFCWLTLTIGISGIDAMQQSAFACGRSVDINKLAAASEPPIQLSNGVRIGMPEPAVTDLLGPPSERRHPPVRCPSKDIILSYPGGKIVLSPPSTTKTTTLMPPDSNTLAPDTNQPHHQSSTAKAGPALMVSAIMGTGPDWIFPGGGKVGDDRDRIYQLYGAPSGDAKRNYLYYRIDEQILEINFNPNGKVLWIRLSSPQSLMPSTPTAD